jgi:hypothetical protein
MTEYDPEPDFEELIRLSKRSALAREIASEAITKRTEVVERMRANGVTLGEICRRTGLRRAAFQSAMKARTDG